MNKIIASLRANGGNVAQTAAKFNLSIGEVVTYASREKLIVTGGRINASSPLIERPEGGKGQRLATNWRRVQQIADNFDIALVRAIEVNIIVRDGRIAVRTIDGDHRIQAAKCRAAQTGEDIFLPAIIHFGLTSAEESNLFTVGNRVNAVSARDRWFNSVNANYDGYVEADQILKELGVGYGSKGMNYNRFSAMENVMFGRGVQRDGSLNVDTFRFAFEVLAATWLRLTDRNASTIAHKGFTLEGVAKLINDNDMLNNHEMADRFLALMGSLSPDMVQMQMVTRQNRSQVMQFASVVAEEYASKYSRRKSNNELKVLAR